MYRPHSSRNYSDAVGESRGAMSTPHVCGITALFKGEQDRAITSTINKLQLYKLQKQKYQKDINGR